MGRMFHDPQGTFSPALGSALPAASSRTEYCSCERRWDTGLFTYSLSVVAFPRQHWSRIVVINCSVFKAKNVFKNLTFCRKNVADIWPREIFVL